MNIIVAGDFVPEGRVSKQINAKKYLVFDNASPIIKSADYSIVNLESPVVIRKADPLLKTGPCLHCNESAIEALSYAGFKCVSLANNHFRDYGQIGIEDTLKCCSENGIEYVGGGKDIEEANKIHYVTINNQTISVVNFCENEWSIATKNHGGAAALDIVQNVRTIRIAKEHSDFVLVIIHGGSENYQLPSPRMKQTYRFFIEQGADAVINHHQHCFSGYEVYEGRPIFYGLGNFSFDRQKPSGSNWNYGYMVSLEFNKGKNIEFKIIPYSQGTENSAVVFLENNAGFWATLSELNRIIIDDSELFERYDHFVESKNNILVYLDAYSSSPFQKLRSKGLVPSFLTKKKKMYLLDLFRCESHRDIMLKLLEK